MFRQLETVDKDGRKTFSASVSSRDDHFVLVGQSVMEGAPQPRVLLNSLEGSYKSPVVYRDDG